MLEQQNGVTPEPGDTLAPETQADIQAVRRTSQILELFSPKCERLTVAEVSRRLSLNRTTSHRYLSSLVATGLLSREGTADYVLGDLTVQLGTMALGQRRVLDVAPHHMRRLCNDTHISTVLSLWGSGGPVVSHVEEDRTRDFVVTVAVGTQLDLSAAQSLVWLAFGLDQLRVDRLLQSMPPSLQDLVTRSVEETRRTGIGVRPIEDAGVVAMAAPVFGASGMCASVALIGTSRLLSGNLPETTEASMLRRTVDAISQAMGGEPPALG